jgi:CRISPR/Cas system CMR subunit Cmr4 (Cas7 group RAMP superfamily)
MVRGGQREGAGRKSTWVSGAKFEDTTVIRIPKNIKDKVSVIAYKLDAGEDIDLDSNSKIQELESKLLLLQSDNEVLINQLQNKSLDLETQSKKIQELEQENNQLRNSLNNLNQLEKQLVTNSKEESNDLVTQSEKHTQLDLSDIVVEDKSTFINELKSDSLSGKLLALRIGVSNSTLSNKKTKLSDSDFSEWVQGEDPDKIKWVSLGGSYSKGYVPADNTSIDSLQALKNWIQDHT